MKIKGIKRGRTIELLEQINNIPDGTEIIVELEIAPSQINTKGQPLTDEERLARLNKLFGAWKDQPDLMEVFAEINEQRHTYQGRVIDSIDHQDNS
jgi:antitoxin ParD1/3/4